MNNDQDWLRKRLQSAEKIVQQLPDWVKNQARFTGGINSIEQPTPVGEDKLAVHATEKSK